MDQSLNWGSGPVSGREETLFAALMATETAYFRMGSQITSFEGGEAAVMPDFASLAGAAVIQNVAPSIIADKGSAWIDNTEKTLRDAGVRLSRIYILGDHAGAARILGKAGYDQRVELGFCGSLQGDGGPVQLYPVDNEDDWAAKVALHEAVGMGPDGHSNEARSFVELERAKSAAGLQCFLAKLDGKVVGTIGAIWGDELVRAKNLLVHPRHQRHGIATAMLAHLSCMAHAKGLQQLGVFGIEDEAGSALYRDVGLRIVGSQVEWSKCLEAKNQ